MKKKRFKLISFVSLVILTIVVLLIVIVNLFFFGTRDFNSYYNSIKVKQKGTHNALGVTIFNQSTNFKPDLKEAEAIIEVILNESENPMVRYNCFWVIYKNRNTNKDAEELYNKLRTRLWDNISDDECRKIAKFSLYTFTGLHKESIKIKRLPLSKRINYIQKHKPLPCSLMIAVIDKHHLKWKEQEAKSEDQIFHSEIGTRPVKILNPAQPDEAE